MRSLLLVIAVVGCGGRPATKLPVTVALFGDPSLGRAIRAALPAGERFAAEIVELPAAAAGFDATPVEQALARARALYLSEGDYDRCKDELADPALIASSLGADRRDLAARVLLWRVTCLERSGNKVEAARAAETFAVLGLSLPDEVEAASIEAQTLLVATLARQRVRVKVTIAAEARDAAVVIDGAHRCPIPCGVDLVPGDHVLRLDDLGARGDARIHRVDKPATIELPVIPAEPAVAAGQWTQRFGSGGPDEISSPSSAALLRQAIGSERLVVMTFASGPSGAVFGRLVDGRATLAAVRRGFTNDRAVGGTANALLDDLLVEAKLLPPPQPPLARRWWFWVAVAGVATAATFTTYYFVAPRDVEPRLTL
jgi:hypothetical protein